MLDIYLSDGLSVRVGSTVWYLGGKGGNHFQVMLHKIYVYVHVCTYVCGFFLARMMSVAYDNIKMINCEGSKNWLIVWPRDVGFPF